MYRDYLKIGIDNILHRKVRSWLTMIGIFIGVAAVVSMIGLGQGLQQAIDQQFNMLGANKIVIGLRTQMGPSGGGGPVKLTDSDINELNKVSGVDLVTSYLVRTARVEYNNQVKYLYVIGFSLEPDQLKLLKEMLNYGIAEGRDLKSGDKYKVSVGYDLRYKKVFDKPVATRDKITLNGVQMEVVGVNGRVGNPSDDSQIYIPIETLRTLYNIDTKEVDAIIVKVQDGQNPSDVADLIKRDLRRSRGEKRGEESFYVQTTEQIIQSFNTVLNIVQTVVIGIAAISLVVGGIGIMNTMYTAVLERTREIGILKAIGARNSDVLILFLIESGLLGMAGGIIGVLLGLGLSNIVAAVARTAIGVDYFQVYFPWYLIVGALMFSFLIGCASGLLPAWQASKHNPVDSLRYE